jgi:hypothetical protein
VRHFPNRNVNLSASKRREPYEPTDQGRIGMAKLAILPEVAFAAGSISQV